MWEQQEYCYAKDQNWSQKKAFAYQGVIIFNKQNSHF